MPYAADPYGSTDPYAGGPPGGPQAAGQFGRGPRDTGSRQAAGPQPGAGWAGQPNARNTGSWSAAGAGPGPGPDWAGQQAPYGPGAPSAGGWQEAGPGFGASPRNTGSWRAAGPEQSQGWAGAPAGGPSGRDTGSWQAAGRAQEAGWAGGQEQFGAGQFGPGVRNTGAWQAAGAGSGPGWAGNGQPPYPGQPYPGQPYPGQPYPGADGSGLRNTGGFSRAGGPVIRQRDSAIPDPAPNGKGPIAAIETDNIAAFARDLRVLRSKVGLDYPDMAEKSHYTMRTLASAAGGLRLPTLPVLIAYVNACGGDVGDWEERWGRLTKSGKKGHVALTSGDQEAAGGQAGQADQPRIPPGARQTGEIYVITSARPRDADW
jgi:hypothetical protein